MADDDRSHLSFQSDGFGNSNEAFQLHPDDSDFVESGGEVAEEKKVGSDPWSNSTWADTRLNASMSFRPNAADADIFEFSATSSRNNWEDTDTTSFFFSEADFTPPAVHSSKTSSLPRVQVALHEQLSALYDDVSVDPICQIEGSIHVKPSLESTTVGNSSSSNHHHRPASFSLVLKDRLRQIERIEPRSSSLANTIPLCQNVSSHVSRAGLHKADIVLRVTPPLASGDQEMPIATYYCTPTVRPVPLLVKSRVQITGRYSRVGFKIRANPTNDFVLTQIVILLAVPPYVDGATVKMSRAGGYWDDMKRTLSWVLEELPPGQALEIQVQFESNNFSTPGSEGQGGGGGGGNHNMSSGDDRMPRFPILVRGDMPTLWSSVDLHANASDAMSRPVHISLTQSGRVLHRKV